MRICDIFQVEYPKTLIYSEMMPDPGGINFVSSQGTNNNVVGKVRLQPDVKIYPAGVITVPLKGTVLSAHLQAEPCYVAHQVAVLLPKAELSPAEKLYYCTCIQANAFRFSYGRQADKTLKNIELPPIPPSIAEISIQPVRTSIEGPALPLPAGRWSEFRLSQLFTVKYGVNLELANCEITSADDPEGVNFVARTSVNNGVAAKVKPLPWLAPQPAGLLTCSGGGSVLSTFVQRKKFYSGRDLYLLIPKERLSLYVKLFLCTVIRENKYRFSYGRQANKTLPHLILKLPAADDGAPDYDAMERFMKSLPYADRI